MIRRVYFLAVETPIPIDFVFFRSFLFGLGPTEFCPVRFRLPGFFLAPSFFSEPVQIYDIRHTTASFKRPYSNTIFKPYPTKLRAETTRAERRPRRIG